VDSGIYPQLLNDISEDEMQALLNNDRYGLQEKKDGRRLLIETHSEPTSVRGINRKGQQVPAAQEIILQALTLLTESSGFIIDGEAIGDVLYAFDLLELNGEDIRDTSVEARHLALETLVDGCTHIQLVPMYWDTKGKKAALDRIRKANGEGVVFKLLTAPYTPGRPNSGGTQLKFKLWAEVDVIVCESRAGKRSVGMQVYDGQGELIPIGNVTIPANYDIPAVGRVGAVKYLYYFPGGSLYQPQWRGVRDDKEPAECVLSQLKARQPVDE
jgi:bifunctional non-homologous end joining protein LigD